MTVALRFSSDAPLKPQALLAESLHTGADDHAVRAMSLAGTSHQAAGRNQG
jgi:hypothetical protein